MGRQRTKGFFFIKGKYKDKTKYQIRLMFPEHFSFNRLLNGLLELRTCLSPGIRYIMFYEIATKDE